MQDYHRVPETSVIAYTGAYTVVMSRLLLLAVLLTNALGTLCAQSEPAARVIGQVITLDAATRQIQAKTDKGDALTIVLNEKSAIRKVPPGATDLSKASTIQFSELDAGDRVLAIGQSAGGKFEARTLVVMSRGDLAEKQKREQEDWRKRGLSGTVTAVDPATNTFTMNSGAASLNVKPAGKADIRRYSPDSVQFANAKPSTIAELKPGDLVRVLGDRTDSDVVAERIVAGTFQQIAATVTSINADKITLKDLASKKTITVRVSSESTLKKLPADQAESIAKKYKAGGRAADDIGAVLEKLQALPVSELKPGDALLLSLSTGGTEPLAVMLLAGVEPLLTASPNAARDILGGWNLGNLSQ
jgi:hypothetical protein